MMSSNTNIRFALTCISQEEAPPVPDIEWWDARILMPVPDQEVKYPDSNADLEKVRPYISNSCVSPIPSSHSCSHLTSSIELLQPHALARPPINSRLVNTDALPTHMYIQVCKSEYWAYIEHPVIDESADAKEAVLPLMLTSAERKKLRRGKSIL